MGVSLPRVEDVSLMLSKLLISPIQSDIETYISHSAFESNTSGEVACLTINSTRSVHSIFFSVVTCSSALRAS